MTDTNGASRFMTRRITPGTESQSASRSRMLRMYACKSNDRNNDLPRGSPKLEFAPKPTVGYPKTKTITKARMSKLLRIALVCCCVQWGFASAAENATERVSRGLVVLYDFADNSGDVIRDRAGTNSPVDLKIENTGKVRRAAGSLEIRGSTLVRNIRPPKRLSSAIRKNGAVSIEAWIKPSKTDQSGPARIVTLSKDSSNRNFTLGQDGEKYEVRFRFEKSSNNGQPVTSSKPGSLQPALTHVVYTRDRDGDATIWLNGEINSTNKIEGKLSNWDNSMQLALGNEINKSRAWLGTYHLVAIYKRALSPDEIQRNYSAGAGAAAPPMLVKKARDPRELHFELEVAPILANQCLECHDSLAQQGGLDLSKKAAAFEGGDSGAAVLANNAPESLLWQSIDSDEMPHDRPPLSDREKETIKKWIDDGAAWSLSTIDPAIYVHGGRPDANWLRRLTIPEYVETIRALFDIDISMEAQELLPADVRADGFSNTAYNLNVDLKHIEAYQKLAEIVVQRIDVTKFRKRFKTRIAFTDKDMADLIKKMGRVILRGPVSDREVIAYRGISTTTAATDNGNKEEAIALLIEAFLQSPRFIYRVERQRGDGTSQPIDSYELASRMSYMIWGGPPDAKLFDAAEGGDLYDAESIGVQATRMLNDDRAIVHSERFFADWLNLSRLNNMQPNAEKYPKWKPELASDMQKETIAFFHDVIWKQSRPMSDLLNAKVTFATPRLANHYGLPPEAAVVAESDGELIRYDLTKAKARGGMLTQGSLLTVGGDEASMVTRGLLVMHELLRGVVKDPPPCVDTTPVPTKPGLSQRSIAENRISNETCGGCHSRFEPLAFGLEVFDGLGSYHEEDEHGNELREDGQILFPGASEKVNYKSARELMDLMAGSDRVKESITWKLTQFALGRPLTGADARAVQTIHDTAQKDGGTYQATMMAIVTSELVTMMQTDSDN